MFVLLILNQGTGTHGTKGPSTAKDYMTQIVELKE